MLSAGLCDYVVGLDVRGGRLSDQPGGPVVLYLLQLSSRCR